jgi:sporulation protein YlmC with PRC-barrel domain
MGIFSSFKDNLSSFSGEQVISKMIERYGELKDFKINSSSKTIYLRVLLKGESEPVDIKVKSYEVIENNERIFVRINDIETSKAWLTTLAKDYLLNQSFEIPGKYSSLIKKFI